MTFVLIIFLSAANATELNYVEGEALVVFKTDSENVQVSAADVDSEIVENYEALSKVDTEANLKLADSDLDSSLRRFVLIRSKNKTTEQLISELKNRPDVIAASPNYKVRRNLSAVQEELIPNDSSTVSAKSAKMASLTSKQLMTFWRTKIKIPKEVPQAVVATSD